MQDSGWANRVINLERLAADKCLMLKRFSCEPMIVQLCDELWVEHTTRIEAIKSFFDIKE